MINWLINKLSKNKSLKSERTATIPQEVKLTLKRQPIDHRDYKLKANVEEVVSLPQKYRIPILPPVRSQGNVGSCHSHSVAAILETQFLNSRPHKFLELSELYHYWVVRHLISDDGDADSGQTIRDGFKAVDKYNLATEYAWPYVPAKFNVKPPFWAFLTSGFCKTKGYYFFTDLNSIKASLMNNIPVATGINIYDSFYRITKNNPVYEPSGNTRGGHSTYIVEFDDSTKMFRIRNHWGVGWGDSGEFEMSYDTFLKHAWDWGTIHLK